MIGALQDEVQVPLEYRAEEGDLYCRVEEPGVETRKLEDADLLLRSMKLACRQIQCTYGSEYIDITQQLMH